MDLFPYNYPVHHILFNKKNASTYELYCRQDS